MQLTLDINIIKSIYEFKYLRYNTIYRSIYLRYNIVLRRFEYLRYNTIVFICDITRDFSLAVHFIIFQKIFEIRAGKSCYINSYNMHIQVIPTRYHKLFDWGMGIHVKNVDCYYKESYRMIHKNVQMQMDLKYVPLPDY